MASSTTVYVHVPFCVVKCGYCDFNSYAVDDLAVVDRFLDGLERELALIEPPRRPPSLFLGGGTPTWLDEGRFARMLEILRERIDLEAVPEVTMEANPESTTLAKAKRARQAGINRLSIGAQSFDAERLRFLDRAHDAEGTRRAFAAVREAGFDNVSLDLMFGLPGQTVAEWERDLERALTLGPDHMSCYNLTFEAGTRLEAARRKGLVEPNDDAVDREMFELTRARLKDAGFAAYEISNFAGRGGPCRHNDHYWLQGDYLGYGPGAASHLDGWRGTNLKPVEAWARATELGFPATGEAETLGPKQRVGEALWLGLRRRDGVDLDRVERRLGLDPRALHAAALAHYQEAGLVELDESMLRLTTEGLLQADEVGAAFL